MDNIIIPILIALFVFWLGAKAVFCIGIGAIIHLALKVLSE